MVKPLKPISLFHTQIHRHLFNFRSVLTHSSQPNLHPQITKPPYPNLVDNVSRILTNPRWFENEELKHVSHKIGNSHVARIVTSHRNTDVVIRFFYWIMKTYCYKHDLNCYKVMLGRLVRESRFGDADHIRVLMVKECGNEEELMRAVDYLNELRRKGFGFGLYLCNTLLIRLGKFGTIEAARDVFVQMQSDGVKPSLLTYNTMINMVCKKGRVPEAESYYDQMVEGDLGPDVFTFSSS